MAKGTLPFYFSIFRDSIGHASAGDNNTLVYYQSFPVLSLSVLLHREGGKEWVEEDRQESSKQQMIRQAGIQTDIQASRNAGIYTIK